MLLTGFNAFKQWTGNKLIEEGFSEVNVNSSFSINQLDWRNKLALQWCYNAFIKENGTLLTGFYGDNPTKPIETPMDLKFELVAANDKHMLFVNNHNNVWELSLESKDKRKWKLIPTFVGVENCNVAGDDKCEKIIKMACGETMNLVLTDKGNVFDIPSKIVDFNDCDGKVIDVACGFEHAILLTDKGNVYTWGGGSRCQLGHGDIENRDHPELVNALAGVIIIKIAAGGWHCCSISECGDLYSWGWNDKGQLGVREREKQKKVNDTNDKMSPVYYETKDEHPCVNYALPMLIDFYPIPLDQVDRLVIDVECGSKHTVAKLDDGSIWVSGWNEYSQLGLSEKCSSVRFFRVVKQDMHAYNIICGPWSTVLLKIS